jgi:hypothetical protein
MRLFRAAQRRGVKHGRVAQLVEQGIENPRVGGSIPSPATMLQTAPRLAFSRAGRFRSGARCRPKARSAGRSEPGWATFRRSRTEGEPVIQFDLLARIQAEHIGEQHTGAEWEPFDFDPRTTPSLVSMLMIIGRLSCGEARACTDQPALQPPAAAASTTQCRIPSRGALLRCACPATADRGRDPAERQSLAAGRSDLTSGL